MLFFMRAKHINGDFEGASTFWNDFFCLSLRSEQFGVQKSLGSFEKPLEIADYGFCQHKIITSRTIGISGALKIKTCWKKREKKIHLFTATVVHNVFTFL
jgi:hypothetical protein